MCDLLVHRDAEWAAKHGHRVGDVGGIKLDGEANPNERYFVVRVPDMSKDEAAMLCAHGAPAHLVERHRVEWKRHSDARNAAFFDCMPDVRRQELKMIDRIKKHGPPPAKPYGRPNTPERRDAFRKWSKAHDKWSKTREDIFGHGMLAANNVRNSAVAAVGHPDPELLMDYDAHPRRQRRIDLTKIGEQVGGIFTTTSADLLAAVVENGGGR